MAVRPVTVDPNGKIDLQRVDHLVHRHEKGPQRPAAIEAHQGAYFLRAHPAAHMLGFNH